MDSSGAPASELTQSDFSVFENGKPESIDFFEKYAVSGAQSRPSPSLPPRVYNNQPFRGALQTILLLDDLDTEPTDQALARKQVASIPANIEARHASRSQVDDRLATGIWDTGSHRAGSPAGCRSPKAEMAEKISPLTRPHANASVRFYNRSLFTSAQRERIEVVLVSPRNPLNIGAVARAMANFGFSRFRVVAPYEPHWREAKSAVGSAELLQSAEEFATLGEAVRDCTLVLGTGTLTYRKPEQPVVLLNELAVHVNPALQRGARIAVVLGPEKHGLTREDLSRCHLLVEIPTDPLQPSMNLGQAAAVLLYELATGLSSEKADAGREAAAESRGDAPTTSGNLDILAGLIEQVMVAAKYSPRTMQGANQHDLRVMLRRLHLNAADTRRALGLFRRILWRIGRGHRNVTL